METEREKELHGHLSAAMMTLWNVQGVLNLLGDEGTIGKADFPASVASALRMMQAHVDSTVAAIHL